MPLCPQITNTPITVSQTGDFTVTSVIPAVSDTIDGLAQDFSNIVVQLDDKTKAYYQNDPPTGPGLNEGDIWFDTNDGNKQYFYTGTAWVSVQDTAIAAAAAAASAAQSTADGKNRIYRQTTQPTGGTYVEGDLWFDTDDDNKIYRFTSGSWATAVPLGNNALGNLSANKITSGSIDASVITVSNINAGNISTGTLNADRIAAASITGSKLVAGTITASQIASATITATQIASGTITATQIASSTITTDKLVAGTLTGFTVTATSGTKSITLSGSTAVLTISDSSTGFLTGGGINIISSGVTGSYGARALTFGGTVAFSNDGSGNAFIQAGSNNTIRLSPNGGTYNNTYPVVIEGVLDVFSRLNVGGVVFFTGLSTSTAATNLRIGANGQILEVVSSSERFKENIVNLNTVFDLDPKKLLQLPVRAFTYKETHLTENDDRFDVMIPGFIAEEVDSIYPIAADYDGDGPKSWNDRIMIPGLLALIQDLYKEIEQLKGE
jgi:hypothetical protein